MPDPPERKPETQTQPTDEKNSDVKIHQLTDEEREKLPKEQRDTAETLVDDAIHGGTAG